MLVIPEMPSPVATGLLRSNSTLATANAKTTMIEVEMKFPLADSSALVARLEELGATAGDEISQTDRYYNHPARDFAGTDEALRIRSIGDRHFVTYKGPLLDAVTKSRREIELPIGAAPDDGGRFHEMLVCLGFQPVREVSKTRVPFTFQWEDRAFEAVLDDVAGLGTFAEIETTADDADRPAATESLQRLAAHLGLENSTRRSYLGMLLEADAD